MKLDSSDGDDVVVAAAEEKEDGSLEAELEAIYEQICDKAGLISKTALRNWDEIQKLLDEGLIGEDEFDDLWSKTKKSNGGSSEETLDVDGFLSFNVALDDLFDFDDEEMEDGFVDDDDDEEEEEEDREEQASLISKATKVASRNCEWWRARTFHRTSCLFPWPTPTAWWVSKS